MLKKCAVFHTLNNYFETFFKKLILKNSHIKINPFNNSQKKNLLIKPLIIVAIKKKTHLYLPL